MSKAKSKGKAKARAVASGPATPVRRQLTVRPSTADIRTLLERDLIEWADDLELRLVWADLLQVEGDPLGRLVNLDHAAASDASVKAEADALREALAHRLQPPQAPWLQLHWQLGYVHLAELHIETRMPAATDTRRRGRQISAVEQRIAEFLVLLERPAMRFLDTIHVVVDDDRAREWSRLLWHVSHATLREVHIGEPPRLRARPSGLYEVGRAQSREYDFSKASYMTKMPRLQRVTVAGELARLPCRDGSTETRTHHVRKLAQRPMTSANRASLRRALWDVSSKVQDMAHQTIRALGPAADFMAEELLLLLLPPIGERDPRQVDVLTSLAAIGPASAGILPTLLSASDLTSLTMVDPRCVALLGWLRTLGPAARPAASLIESLTSDRASPIRKAALAARKALGG
jgi:hypothetical protein